MNKWKPSNFRGHICEDPRDELKARIACTRKIDPNTNAVSIPLDLALAVAELRECGSRTIISFDEDGKIDPTEIQCIKLKGHLYDHYNGYTNWK